MLARSSSHLDAEVMTALVAEKFNLQQGRDRELIRWLAMLYLLQGYQIPLHPTGNNGRPS
jgi:hypothetical protein